MRRYERVQTRSGSIVRGVDHAITKHLINPDLPARSLFPPREDIN